MHRLIAIARPPVDPVGCGSKESWNLLEEKWKLTFPTKYKEFLAVYGAGRFNDFIGIPSPFWNPSRANPYEKFVTLRINGVRFAKENMPKYATELPVYPDAGGLFPFGYTDNGGTMFWQTGEDPEKWPIVCLNNAYSKELDCFSLSIDEFLGNWLSALIEVPSLTPPDFFPLEREVFKKSS